jgi:hypothetical protein
LVSGKGVQVQSESHVVVWLRINQIGAINSLQIFTASVLKELVSTTPLQGDSQNGFVGVVGNVILDTVEVSANHFQRLAFAINPTVVQKSHTKLKGKSNNKEKNNLREHLAANRLLDNSVVNFQQNHSLALSD